MSEIKVNSGLEQWASQPVRPGANSKVSEEEHGLFQRFLGKSTEPFGLRIRELLKSESTSGMEKVGGHNPRLLSYEEIFAEGVRAARAAAMTQEKI